MCLYIYIHTYTCTHMYSRNYIDIYKYRCGTWLRAAPAVARLEWSAKRREALASAMTAGASGASSEAGTSRRITRNSCSVRFHVRSYWSNLYQSNDAFQVMSHARVSGVGSPRKRCTQPVNLKHSN